MLPSVNFIDTLINNNKLNLSHDTDSTYIHARYVRKI